MLIANKSLNQLRFDTSKGQVILKGCWAIPVGDEEKFERVSSGAVSLTEVPNQLWEAVQNEFAFSPHLKNGEVYAAKSTVEAEIKAKDTPKASASQASKKKLKLEAFR